MHRTTTLGRNVLMGSNVCSDDFEKQQGMSIAIVLEDPDDYAAATDKGQRAGRSEDNPAMGTGAKLLGCPECEASAAA